MKKLILGVLLIFIFQMANAQFHFLEKNKGVKEIEFSIVSGKKANPNIEVKHTKYFNSDGNLQKIEFSWATFEYHYEGDVVVEVFTRKRNDCSSVKEYHLSWEGNMLTIKEKDHSGKYTPQKECERSMIDRDVMGLPAGHLFKDLEIQIKTESDVNQLTRIKYSDVNNHSEYEQYIYTKTRKANTFKIYSIKTFQKNNENSYLERRFAYQPYGMNPGIIMEWQGIVDEFGDTASYLDVKVFHEIDEKDYVQWKYLFDDKNNWVKRVSTNDSSSDSIYEKVRNIEYYK